MSTHIEGSKRGRGRPAQSGGPGLNREAIIHQALAIAGADGFKALSMHRLARELGVSTKALYNHVRDRQDVINGVAALMMHQISQPMLDSQDWRGSLREAYREARQVYRQFPRAILISLDETVTATEVDPQRILLAENMLRFFIDIGLSLQQAITVRSSFLIDVFGFVLTVDYRYDTGDDAVRTAMFQPVPQAWLDTHPEVHAPLSHQAAALPSASSDTMFESLLDLRVLSVEALLIQTAEDSFGSDD